MSTSKKPSLYFAHRSKTMPRVEDQGKLFDRESFDVKAPANLASELDVDSSAHYLARESVQNSIDAFYDKAFQAKVNPGGVCKIKFKYVSLFGNEKKKMLESLGINLETLEDHYKCLTDEQDREKSLSKAVKKLKKLGAGQELNLLIIEEELASGMYHSSNDEDDLSPSKLYSATLAINSSDKNGTDLGSYGQGKTALLSSSRLRLNYVYTEYGWHSGHGHTAALLGFCSWPSHILSGQKYSGYGYFANSNPGDQAPIPFYDEAARSIAKGIGLTRSGHGSTILIVDPTFTYEELEKALLVSWWPAILNNKVNISIAKTKGIADSPRYTVLDPRNGILKDELAGFCAAHEAAQNKAPDSELGKLGIVEHSQLAATSPSKVAYVAKTRQIGLIVEYQKVADCAVTQGMAVYGFFQASEDSDKVLRRTENKGHTVWDTTRHKDSEGTKKAKEVRAYIKKMVSDFAQGIRNSGPQDYKTSSVLSKLLNGFTNNPSSGNGTGNNIDPPINPPQRSSKSTLILNPKISYDPVGKKFIIEFTVCRASRATINFRYIQDGRSQKSDSLGIDLEVAGTKSGKVQQDADGYYSLNINTTYKASTKSTSAAEAEEIKNQHLDAGWDIAEEVIK